MESVDTEKLICPDCKRTLKRRVDAPAQLYKCACGKEWVWVMIINKLVLRQEFHQTADIYNT